MNSVYKGCHSERPEGFSEVQDDKAHSSASFTPDTVTFSTSAVSKHCPLRPVKGIALAQFYHLL